AVGADPDIALRVLQQIIDKGIGEGAIDKEELFLFAIIAVDSPTPGAYPDVPVAVFEEGGDKIIADGVFVVFEVPEYREVVAIVFVEAVAGTQPHKTPAVLQDAGDVGLGQTGLCANMLQL